MSPDKPMISIDGEWLLKRIQQIEFILDNIRAKASKGAFTQPTPTGIDLVAINWLVKGMEPFRQGDKWGWAFGFNEDGTVKEETEALIKVIERDGKAIIDGYEITLSGRDNRLLSRQKVKRP